MNTKQNDQAPANQKSLLPDWMTKTHTVIGIVAGLISIIAGILYILASF